PEREVNEKLRDAVAVTPCWATIELDEVVLHPVPATLPMTAWVIPECGSREVKARVKRPDVPARNHTVVPRATASPSTVSSGTWGDDTSVHTIAVRAVVALPALSYAVTFHR